MPRPPIHAIPRRSVLIGLALLTARPAQAQVAPDWQAAPWQVMMVTKPGCLYCETWRAQIGPGYAASPTGRAAPLFEVDINGPYPDGLALDRNPRITPTFVLLERGIERGRVEGYVGQQYFHPVLLEVMDQAGLRP